MINFYPRPRNKIDDGFMMVLHVPNFILKRANLQTIVSAGKIGMRAKWRTR